MSDKDKILTTYHNKNEKDIIYKPRTGAEMENATYGYYPLLRYSELCELGEKKGANRMLAQMFRRSDKNIILLQNPDDMNSGHWFSVSRNLPKKEIYFFSTYGGKPDVEKISWMNEDDLRQSGQILNIFNDGLYDAQKHGWKIYYNDYPYQKPGDNTAVCGIYTAAFLNSGKNPDEFEEDTKAIMRSGINPAIYYYKKYFLHLIP